VCRWESTCASAGAAGAEVATVEVTQVVGAWTRSRAASAVDAASGGVAKVVSKRRKALPLATEPAALGFGGDDGSCYLQLRSRMLFKAPSASPQKGISGWMELIATVEEASTMKAGGENSCIVAMPVL
jgi:hypothetical protein